MITHLVDELTVMNVIGDEDLHPKLGLAALDKVTSLLLEHRVLVRHGDELIVAEALGVAMHASAGSRASQNLPTTSGS